MADFSLNVKINGVEQAVNTVSQIEEALIATRNELKNVAIGSDAFEKLSTQAQTLQREFVNSYKETTNFNKGIAELGQSMGSLASSVTAGFTIATTAISMFGKEGESVTEAQAKAQQALALALSATTIATNAKTIAEDINNVGVALQNGLTKLLTVSLGASTLATAAQAVATGTATVAQRALNAAMTANPIGLVIAAVATLVGAFLLLGSEEKKTYTYTRDLNTELDNNTIAIKNNLDVQKELATLQGKVNEATAKSDMAKLEARIATQKEIDKIAKQEVEADIANTESKLKNQQKTLQGGAGYVEAMMNQTKDLQDFNLESKLNAEQKEYAQLIRSRQNGFITEKQYADSVVEVYKRYFSTQDEERQKDFQEQVKNYDALKGQRDKLTGDLKIAAETQTNNEKLAEIQRQQQREEDAKKYRDNLKKRKDALQEYNDDVKKLDEDRDKRQRDAERALQDFINDRISIVISSIEVEGKAYTVYNEDLIAGYDETLAKLKVARQRDQEDASRSFEAELKSFEETEKKKVDNNNKRVVSDKTIQDEIDKRRIAFYGRENMDEGELFNRQQQFAEQIVIIQDEKASKILEIDQTLKRELTFGDNNMNDSKKKLVADELGFRLQIAQRQLEIEKQSIFDRIRLGDEEKAGKLKTQVEMLKTIQTLQKQQRAAELAAALEALNIQRQQDLKTIQGTEEQKKIQKEAIDEEYRRNKKKLDDNADLAEKEATRKSLQEITDLRIANLQKITDLAAQIANSILGVFNAFNELAKVNSENYLREQRDAVAQQTNDLNVEYNAQRASLDEKLAAGVISQQQYNQTIKGLDTGLTKSTEDLNKAYRAKELAEKKKAFESDKKLKIAQAIISGIQGAVSAFTGAFQLGPIAGPIVGGILAGLVAATTAVQVSAISKTKFDGGAPEITAPNTGGTSATDSGAAAVSSASSGGFTGFNQGLLGTPGGAGATGTVLNPQSPQRVYILESDITNTQRRVSTLESNASFG
jgi:hypothetical protein